MKNLVYIWHILAEDYSLDFKPVYLVYYKAEPGKPVVVWKLHKIFRDFA